MANPNPFYRFKPAWNFGFFPDNQITSDLLNEIYVSINAAIGAYIVPTTKFAQLVNFTRLFVADYNKQPYYGKFDVTNTYNTTTGAWTISIFNKDLVATDNTQEIVISGTSNPSNTESISYTIAFTVGNYSGTYGPTLINEEVKIQDALQCVSLNGSAIFPITYKYDPSLGLATSGLARGMNWQLSNGAINRLPIETTPRQNRRTFELPQLTGDDTYVLSIMERIIQGAFTYVDFNTSILPVYNSFTPPDGWTFSYNYPSFTTYERVQFNFVNPSRRKFILVGRRIGNTYLWQRFVSDSYLNAPYDFLSVYTESTQLPYEPNQAGRWLYNNDTYDFEFVEFTSGCYDSGEFYAMPAKPGDQLQFNIIDGNLYGIDNASIGLFEQDGRFVQKIGQATKLQDIVKTYSFSEFQLLIDSIEETLEIVDILNPFFTTYIQFTLRNSENVLIWHTTGDIDSPTYSISIGQYIAFLSSLGFVVTIEGSGPSAVYTIKYLIDDLTCDDTYTLKQFAGYPEPNTFIMEFDEFECICPIIESIQHHASVTIPSKQGCYRFGLYSSTSNGGGGGSNCNLTFTKSLTGAEYDNWIEDFVTVMYSGTKRVGWQIDGLTQMYIYDGNTYPPPYNPEDIASWCNSNIPGMTATYTQAPNVFTWTWTVNVPCGTADYSMVNCEVNVLTEDCVNNLWTTDAQNCQCSGSGVPTDFYLYSLSNIINIDRADCFSTILEFWADSNAIAQGNEYYSDWKQRVRIGLNGGGEKPIIEESLYRQSNGVHRRPQNKQDLSIDLHTDFFDLETQLAMTDATRHPNLVWEGKPIFVKGDIEVATIQDFTTQSSFETLSQMKFQALLQGFQPKNSTCINC
jgi:hypothetical protein